MRESTKLSRGYRQLLVDDQTRPYLWVDYCAYNAMTTLDGFLYAKACVWYWDFWKAKWRQKCWREDFVDWDGYKATVPLFEGEKRIDL